MTVDAAADAPRAGFTPSMALGPALVAAVVVAAAYLPGADRALDYDSAQTVGSYVRTPSLVDAVSSQRLFNNHPAFSLVEHVVYSLTGSDADWVLRLAPIAFAAAAVAVLVAVLQRHLGPVPAVCAGLIVATNPTVVELSRAVRGYSLLLLCGIVASAALARLLDDDRPPGRASAVYVAAVAIGLATHLYMAPIVLGHVAVVVARRAVDEAWVKRWLLGGGLGGVIYVVLLDDILAGTSGGGRTFKPDFPLRVAEVVGGTVPATILLAGVIGVGGWALRGRRDLVTVAAVVGGAVAFTWLVVASVHLEARFHVWLVPAAAAVAAVGVRRRPVLAVVVLLAVGLNVASQVDGYTEAPNALPELALVVDRAEADGQVACVASYTALPIEAYTDTVRVATPDDLDDCDVIVAAFPNLDAEVIGAARRSGMVEAEMGPDTSLGYAFAHDPAVLVAATGGGDGS